MGGPRRPVDPGVAEERRRASLEMEGAIERMSANGLSPQQISLLTNIRPERLYRRYRDSMLKGSAKRTDEVAQAAYLMSVGGPEKDWRRADAGMAKFWLERHGGESWRAPDPRADEGPDLTRLSVSQLIELERALRPLARNPVLIDAEPAKATIVDAEPRGGGGGADAPGAGAEPAGGVGIDNSDAREVPS